MSHIFISYSRKDIDFAGRIVQALAENELDTWIDWKSIPKGEDWEQEIYRGIEEADAFLFLISPDSVISQMCNKEILHAVENNKRILPIVTRDTNTDNFLFETAKKEVSKRNWIFCREGQDDFNKAIDETHKTIHTDYEWLKYHTELQVKALKWERKKDISRLLRGKELREAEQQLAKISGQEDPQPTKLQRDYVVASRNMARQLTIALGLGFSFLVVLSVLTFVKGNEAMYQAKISRSQQLAAQSIDRLLVNHELALLLAIEAGYQAETFEADTALRKAINDSNSPSHTLGICSGHDLEVNYVAWSPGGEMIATASSDGTARIWNAKNCRKEIVLSGHQGPVWFVAWDPKGERIVSTGQDGTARVWSAENGEQLALLDHPQPFLEPTLPIGSAAWDPSGTRIVTASDDGTPRIWEADTGREIVALKGHEGAVTQVTWSPDGEYIASASEDGSARMWKAETGKRVGGLMMHVFWDKAFPVRIVKWSPDGTRLLTVGTDGSVVVWNSNTQKQESFLAGPNFFGEMHVFIHYAEWAHQGKHIVIANDAPENTAEIWDVATEKRIAVLEGHTNVVKYAAWNADDTKIVTASLDRTIRVWDAETGDQLDILTGHTSGIVQALWNADGTRIASISYDHTSRVWTMDPPKYPQVIDFGGLGLIFGFGTMRAAWNPSGTQMVIANDTEDVMIWDIEAEKMVANLGNAEDYFTHPGWSSDGKIIHTTGISGKAYLWDAKTYSALATLSAYDGATSAEIPRILDALLSPDGKYFIVAYSNGSLHIWDMKTHKKSAEVLVTEPVGNWPIAWRPDSKEFSTSYKNNNVAIWNALTAQKIVEFAGHTADVTDIAWSPDGLKLATSSNDKTVRIWNTENGKQLFTLSGHTGVVNSVDWSPDGLKIVTASQDHSARIWDAKFGKEIAIMSAHTDIVIQAIWGPEGDRILTWSNDNTARVWDGKNGVPLSVLTGHGDGLHFTGIVQALWSPTGRNIITIGHDDKALLHEVFIQELIGIGCQYAVRNLSLSEWQEYLGDEPYRATCANLPTTETVDQLPSNSQPIESSPNLPFSLNNTTYVIGGFILLSLCCFSALIGIVLTTVVSIYRRKK